MALVGNLEAYYECASVLDSSGNGWSLVLTPGCTIAGTGMFGNSFAYAALTDVAQTGAPVGVPLTVAGWTVMAWGFNLQPDGAMRELFWNGDPGGAAGYHFVIDDTLPTGELGVFSDGSWWGSGFGMPAASYAGWHHYAATFDSGTGQVKFYVDGLTVGTCTPSWVGPMNVKTIGGQGAAGGGFAERIDDVAMWTKKLRADQIFTIYTQGVQGFPLSALLEEPAQPNTGSAVNDYLVWAWGWEIDAALFSGYSNQCINDGPAGASPPPPPPSVAVNYDTRDLDWYAQEFWPPHQVPAGGGAFYGGLGDPYEPTIGPNCVYPWSVDFCVNPNYHASGPGTLADGTSILFNGAWCDLAPVAISAACIMPGDLGFSFNADFPDPSRTYGAGTKCLLLASTTVTTNGPVGEWPSVYSFPMIWTPHIGKWNRAVSASSGDAGAANTSGPRQGWVQTSYKAVSNLYTFQGPLTGNPPTLLTQLNSAGGNDLNPLLSLWHEHHDHHLGVEQMMVGLFSEVQQPPPFLPYQPTRELMLAIAPNWPTGIGPASTGAPTLGPTFSFPNDRNWHRIAIQYDFRKPLYISASVYVDGEYKAGAMVPIGGEQIWREWNRVALGGGIYPLFFDQLAFPNTAINFAMHDHLLVWGSTGSNGTEKLYIQGVRPNDDVAIGHWGSASSATPQPTALWDNINSLATPDTWRLLGPPWGYGQNTPGWTVKFDSQITQSNNIDCQYATHTYKFGLQNTTDIHPDWRPSDIRGVQQISINTCGDEDDDFCLQYTTMSIGENFVDSWPSPQKPIIVGAPDAARMNHQAWTNMFLIFSSQSFTGNNWTYSEVNIGTGSLFARFS